MKYIGYFNDINDNLYRVEIISQNNSSSVREITLTDEPFTTSISSNDGNIYIPIKCSESTLQIVTDTPLLDLFSGTAKGTSVKLYDKNNTIKWCGYVEPQVFNQDWESDKDILEVNCIDGLATLQYIDYKTISDTKDVRKFIEIISNILSLSGCYTNFYIPTTLSINGDNTVVNEMAVSEHDFFDEDDEPMKCDEVLGEILKFLGFTAVAHGNEVYILDYDGIKNKNNSYFKYSVGSTNYTTVTLSNSHKINADSYAENGGQISLSNVYNKVTVKDDLYPVEEYLPSIWDNLHNVIHMGAVEEVQTPMIVDKKKHHSYFQFFENENWKSYYYQINGDITQVDSLSVLWTPSFPKKITYNNLRSMVGATICKHQCLTMDEYKNNYEGKVPKLSLSNYLVIHQHDLFPPTPVPVFTSILKDTQVVIPKDTYLVISGNATFFDDIDNVDNSMINSISEIIYDNRHSRKGDNFQEWWGDIIKPDKFGILTQLEVGGKYWNGDAWQATECKFYLKFDNNKNNDHFIGKQFPIKNNIHYTDYLNEEGYAIPLDEGMTNISPKVTFYTDIRRIHPSYRHETIWLSNFDIKLVRKSISDSNLITDVEQEDSDTEYTNIINEDYTKEMDEISFKVCTFDSEKQINYSSVSRNNQYVDGVSHLGKAPLKMEENLIEKLVNQYKEPSIILDLNLKNSFNPYTTLTTHFFNNKVFIVDSFKIDWSMNKAELHIIEKK